MKFHLQLGTPSQNSLIIHDKNYNRLARSEQVATHHQIVFSLLSFFLKNIANSQCTICMTSLCLVFTLSLLLTKLMCNKFTGSYRTWLMYMIQKFAGYNYDWYKAWRCIHCFIWCKTSLPVLGYHLHQESQRRFSLKLPLSVTRLCCSDVRNPFLYGTIQKYVLGW